jgi:hypothetical protein
MTRRPTLQPDDPTQSQRFLDLAKELEAEAEDEPLETSVRRLVQHAPEPRRKVGKKARKQK